jgi:hypothetical protein
MEFLCTAKSLVIDRTIAALLGKVVCGYINYFALNQITIAVQQRCAIGAWGACRVIEQTVN